VVKTEPIPTENAEQMNLKFYTKFSIEEDYDYAQIQISPDGIDYIPVCGTLTKPSSRFGNPPIYDGFVSDWTLETICLDDYLDWEEIYVKFNFSSDESVNYDGFFFDDFTLEVIGANYTSTEEIEFEPITVAPNPSQEYIKLHMEAKDFKRNLSYQILDYTGKVIMTGPVNKPQLKIDINKLNEGSFVLQLNQLGQVISSTKFIKQ